MDAVEQIKQFKEFLDEVYKAELSEKVRKGDKVYKIIED